MKFGSNVLPNHRNFKDILFFVGNGGQVVYDSWAELLINLFIDIIFAIIFGILIFVLPLFL